MAKSAVADWSTTASNNTDVGGIDIGEGCAAANVNNAMREKMAQIATWRDTLPALTSDNTMSGDNTFSGANTFSGTVDLSGATVGGASVGLYRFDGVSISSSTAGFEIGIPAGVLAIRCFFWGWKPVTTGDSLQLRCGTEGEGGAFVSTSSYATQLVRGAGSTPSAASATSTAFSIAPGQSAGNVGNGSFWLAGFNGGASGISGTGGLFGVDSTNVLDLRGYRLDASGTYDAIQGFASSGDIASITLHAYALRTS